MELVGWSGREGGGERDKENESDGEMKRDM